MKSKNAKRSTKKTRWKVPWLDFYIVRGKELREFDLKIESLEREFEKELIVKQIRSKVDGDKLKQLAVSSAEKAFHEALTENRQLRSQIRFLGSQKSEHGCG